MQITVEDALRGALEVPPPASDPPKKRKPKAKRPKRKKKAC